MSRPKTFIAILALIAAVAAVPNHAGAEAFLDIYIGGAFTQNDNLSIQSNTTAAKQDIDLESALVYGIKAAYWFEPIPWFGFGADFSFYDPEDKIYIRPLTFLFMVRAQSGQDEEYPYGKTQYYLGVGPSVVFSEVDIRLNQIASVSYRDTETDIGVDARAGVVWNLTPKVGAYLEYRFLHVAPKFTDRVNGIGPIDADLEPSINTHFIIFGIRFNFPGL